MKFHRYRTSEFFPITIYTLKKQKKVNLQLFSTADYFLASTIKSYLLHLFLLQNKFFYKMRLYKLYNIHNFKIL